MKKKVVFILGPTGSGKTALAVSLAKKFDGEIISADSRQVYIGLDVGTGKDLDEYGSVKYHLIDVAMPEENFTLFDWLDQTRKILVDIFSRNKLPIVVGGTGLYAKALIEGFGLRKTKIQISNFKSNSKAKFQRSKLDSMTIEQLQDLIKKLEINTENLDMQNSRRLIRSIEKAQEGIETVKVKPDFDSLILAIDLDRKKLYEQIDKRVELRFENQGMKEEVEKLINSGVDKSWLKSLGLEYKFITEFIEGKYNFEDMIQELKWKTHAYARRQLTWLRKQEGLIWIKNYDEAEEIIAQSLKVL